MTDRSSVLAGLLGAQIVLFVLSLPGFGVETRKFSQYANWAGPVFLGLTLGIFLTGIAGLLLVRRNLRGAARSGIVMAVAAIAIVLFDLSSVAGPPDPPGPLALSAVVLGVSVAILYVGVRALRTAAAPPDPAPS